MSTKQDKFNNTGPWYKHFWPWYLIFMKLAVVTAIIVTVILIYKNPTSMVVDDYYNEGRAINLELNRKERAAELGLQIRLDVQGNYLNLEFAAGEPTDRTALRAMFYHPTLAEHDFEILLPHASAGIYRAEIPTELTGHWRIDIEPFQREWRLSQHLVFPLKKSALIVPKV